MAIYRPGYVNCGSCNEPTDIPAEDWNEEIGGPLTWDGDYVTGGVCVPCRVHSVGVLDPEECGCTDCEENAREAAPC